LHASSIISPVLFNSLVGLKEIVISNVKNTYLKKLHAESARNLGHFLNLRLFRDPYVTDFRMMRQFAEHILNANGQKIVTTTANVCLESFHRVQLIRWSIFNSA
jgi:hypothetical protein